MRQHAPRATAAQEIKDGVEDLAAVMFEGQIIRALACRCEGSHGCGPRISKLLIGVSGASYTNSGSSYRGRATGIAEFAGVVGHPDGFRNCF